MEAGEKEDLLDKQEDTNKKDDQGDDLKEVKVDESGSPVKKDPDAASHDSEKKDPEKGGEEKGGKTERTLVKKEFYT